jgi:catechol 2,3-dioxygenase-like lactoylglutathione lyase family enzyme
MIRRIATVSLVVADYDEAIAFYRDRLGFQLVADTPLGGGKRWVLVAPAGGGARLLLALADGEAERARIGDQTGGRVGFFLCGRRRSVSRSAPLRGLRDGGRVRGPLRQ